MLLLVRLLQDSGVEWLRIQTIVIMSALSHIHSLTLFSKKNVYQPMSNHRYSSHTTKKGNLRRKGWAKSLLIEAKPSTSTATSAMNQLHHSSKALYRDQSDHNSRYTDIWVDITSMFLEWVQASSFYILILPEGLITKSTFHNNHSFSNCACNFTSSHVTTSIFNTIILIATS